MSVELSKRVDGIETKVNEHEGRIATLEVDFGRSDEILTRLDLTINKLDGTVEKILAQINMWKGSEKYQWLFIGSLITAVLAATVKVLFKV